VEEPTALQPETDVVTEAHAAAEWSAESAAESLVEEPDAASASGPMPVTEAPPGPGDWADGIAAESLVEEPPVTAAAPEALAAEDPEALVADELPVSALSADERSAGPPPPPPSWESLLARARELAGAHAAMLIGPEGSLLAATDGWPAAGAAAIAGKLLPMVAPRLAAPDALVPVKLAGQVLSVWRVAVGGRSVTVAALAEQALATEVRPEIDGQIARGSLDG
jgi:hypothetical protein